MMFSTQVLDAAVQTVNALHKQMPFDFGVMLGDAINNTQYNELRRYIDVFDGVDILNMGNVLTDPRGVDSRGLYMGALDGRTPYGDVIGAGPEADFAEPPKIPAADPDRRSLSQKEWMSEFFKTTSTPVGHGFTQANLDNDFAS